MLSGYIAALVVCAALLVAASGLLTAYTYERKIRRAAENSEARTLLAQATKMAEAVQAVRDAEVETARVKEQRDLLADHMTTTRKINTGQSKEIADLKQRIANMERVSRSPLYQEALENKQANHVQAALRLKLAKEEMEAAIRVLTGKDGA